MCGEIPDHEAADRPQKETFASGGSAGKDPYKQVPLNVSDSTSIRLLKILPNANHTIIACELQSASTKSKYTALSYMWGTEEDQQTIVLNGIKVFIRRNLWDFLYQDRIDQRGGAYLLWIDALCINQAGLVERNHQVALMGKIYSQAASVRVWLGLEKELIAAFELGEKIWTDQREWTVKYHEYCFRDFLPFYNNQYWKRAWILQEYVLADSLELQCGPHRMKEVHFRTIADHVQCSDGLEISTYFFTVLEARRKWHTSTGKEYLHPIGILDAFSECLDPRDRIYSTLALTDPKIGIVPDYGKTTVELFREVALKCVVWDGKCKFWLDLLATTLDFQPGKKERGHVFSKIWNPPEIKDFIFQAGIISDYFYWGITEEEFFGQDWDVYVDKQPSQFRDWLQTSRIGQQQPAAARNCLGKRCKIDLEEVPQAMALIKS